MPLVEDDSKLALNLLLVLMGAFIVVVQDSFWQRFLGAGLVVQGASVVIRIALNRRR